MPGGKRTGGYRPRKKKVAGKPPPQEAGVPAPAAPKEFSVSEEQILRNIATEMVVQSRASISGRLGQSFEGERDIYTALGYKKEPAYEDYIAKYRRQDVARAIIDRPVAASWRKYPEIKETDEGGEESPEPTEFEMQWNLLVKQRRIYARLKRLDRLACIGQYSVLLLGFDDAGVLETEVTRAREILFLSPYSEGNAEITDYDEDPKSERFGQPLLYKVKVSTGASDSSQKVHWTRLLHITTDLLEDDNLGSPQLECVYNRLQDLDLVAGGSSEMFWRAGLPGLNFAMDPDAKIKGQSIDDLKEQIEQYMHGLKRYIRTKGIDVKTIQQQMADPKNNVSMLTDLVAAATGIPKRILMGSERGELASTQDERNWNDTIEERRVQHCEQGILRPLIDRLVEVGVLPTPQAEYTVTWPDLLEDSEKEIADLGEVRSRTLKNYVDAVGGDMVIPPALFLEFMLGMPPEDVARISKMVGDMTDMLGGRGEPDEGDDFGDEESAEFEPAESIGG